MNRDFMHAHIERRARQAFEAEARRQSLSIAERARDPASDDYAFMQEIEAEMERDEFADMWEA